jgi:hypothetical protein
MFAWILILSPWVALLSLILHDATKEDSDGSAISIAAKYLKIFFVWAMQKVATTVKAISSSTKPSGPSEIKPARPPKKKFWRRERRVSITLPELELVISEAVKAAPGCEDFVGVMVQHEKPKSRLDPNWKIKGVKFGKSDRKMATEALATVVERTQRELLVSDRVELGLKAKGK